MNELNHAQTLQNEPSHRMLGIDEVTTLLRDLPGWQIVEGRRLTKKYAFKGFSDGVAFVNKVSQVAEEEGHHPDIHLHWGQVRLDIWTHDVNGLTEKDFSLAKKADEALKAVD